MSSKLPKGFVYVRDVVPSICIELSYCGRDNFVGKRIDGYITEQAILTEQATAALGKVQADLEAQGFGLKIYDAYRPKRAVRHFYRWSRDPRDERLKQVYYPDIDKRDLFRAGYIARRSSHTRGSTVDLTIIDLISGEELDMGSIFDFFSPLSWSNYNRIPPKQKANRKLLCSTMMRYGFKPFWMEWWHFTLKNEPFPRTYFDFEVR